MTLLRGQWLLASLLEDSDRDSERKFALDSDSGQAAAAPELYRRLLSASPRHGAGAAS